MQNLGYLAPLGCPAGVDPFVWRRRIEMRLDELLDQSFALITVLDMMEADCDLEDGGDLEPSLGWPSGRGLSQLDSTMRHDDEREADFCDDEDNGDTEPNGDERDCNLAGAETDLEHCDGYYDCPLPIEGGQGL